MGRNYRRIIILFCLLSALFTTVYAQSGSLDFVTIEEEMNLSRDVRTHAPLYFRLLRNRTVNRYFQAMADSIGRHSDLGDSGL
ncbi:MAG: hypothetical protein U5R06_21000 [candidate division KSB1 bacterium]|nr:hypothetical protein [candidate division KSB1 bacterium]